MNSSRRLRLLGAVTTVALLTAGHLRAEAAGPGLAGLVLVVDHLYQIVLVGAVSILCLAVGDRVTAAARLDDLGAVDRLLASVLLGAGAIAVALLAAGLAGVLSRPVVLGVLALAAWWARRGLVRAPDLVVQALRRVPMSVLAAAGIIGLVLLLPALAPPTDWDSLMYHLHLPGQFLEEGRIFLPPDTHHVAFVGLVHMLYVPLLAFGGSSAPALLSLLFALLLPLAVHRLAVRIFDGVTAEVAAVSVWGTTAVALVAVTARVDVTLVLFLTVAHLALWEGLVDGGDRRWLFLSAVLLGLAVGVKYQAGAYVLALSPLVGWWAVRERAEEGGWRDVALAAGILAACASPWFLKNWILLDAPFYPFLAQRQLPVWLAELHGSRVVPESVDAAVFGALSEVREPFGLLDAFLSPERLSPEGEAAFYRVSPLLLSLLAWLLWMRDRKLAWLAVPGLGYLALVLAVSPRTNLRYLLPAVPALTVAASALVVRILRRVASRFDRGDGPGSPADGASDRGPSSGRAPSGVRLVAVGLALASLAPAAAALHGWLPGEASAGHLAGVQSRMEYLNQRRNPALVAHAGLTDQGERPPPEDARVLMMFEAREYYFTVPALQDPLLTNWSLLAPLRGRLDCLRATDITHVLVGTGVLGYYFERGLDPETVRWPAFRTFADRCLEQVLDVPGYVLFRVPSGGRGSPARPDSASSRNAGER